MHILFDASLDSGGWPGPLGSNHAVAGVSWVGQQGLLRILETQVGLIRPALAESVRYAQLLPHLRKTDGFWTRSFEADPLGVAHRLVEWRDYLYLHGWAGEAHTIWLAQLAKGTAPIAPGLPDRMLALTSALKARRRIDLEELATATPLSELPPLVRALFEALKKLGTRIVEQPEAPASTLKLDAIRLIRPLGPLEAADGVADYLATLKKPGECLIISPDATLDVALRRHGLPVVGASASSPENSLLQALPLALDAGWAPADPQRMLEFLTLPVGPIPRRIAGELADALHHAPAVDSDGWRDAIKNVEEPYVERVAVLLTPSATTHFEAKDALKRTSVLTKWMSAHKARLEKDGEDTRYWNQALSQLSTFDSLIESSGQSSFTRPQLARFVEHTQRGLVGLSRFEGQAGFPAVGSPESVLGPAPHVIWWNFSSLGLRWQDVPTMAPEDIAALAKAGIVLPTPAEQSIQRAARSARPWAYASKSLLLVCPQEAEDGSELHPHPLFDEIAASLGKDSKDTLTVGSLEGKTKARKLAALPTPQRKWNVDAALALREYESASSLEKLLGCSLAWTLNYPAKLRSGRGGALPAVDGTLLGTLAHNLLEMVLKGPMLTPDEAAKRTAELFDQEAPRIAAVLFQPGHDVQRKGVKATTVAAAKELYRLLNVWGAKVEAVEEELKRDISNLSLSGTPDLVVSTSKGKAVIDLKWDGLKYRREGLEHGAALQLSLYSRLVAPTEKAMGPVAYFFLRPQRLLSTADAAFPGGTAVEGASPLETWLGLKKSILARKKELSEGVVSAAAVEEEGGEAVVEESELVGDELRVKPSCHFCEQRNVCALPSEAA